MSTTCNKMNKQFVSKIKVLNETEKAYWGAVVDCEAAIIFHKENKRSSTHWYISITQVHKSYLEFLQKMINGGKIYRFGNKGTLSKRKNIYRLQIFRKQEVKMLLTQILPYIFYKVKKKKAEKAINDEKV